MTLNQRETTDRPFGWLLLSISLILTLLTALNFLILPRYAAIGPAVPIIGDDGLVLQNDDPEAIVRQDFPLELVPDARFYEVTAVAEGWNIEAGKHGWERGRIVLLQQVADGRFRSDLPHVLALLKGNPIRWTFRESFEIGAGATHLVARIELLRATGRLHVYSYAARPMTEAPGFRAAADFLFGGWVALLVAMLAWLLLRLQVGRWITVPLTAVAGAALVLSMLPGDLAAPAKILAVGAIDLVSSAEVTEKEKTAALAFNFFRIAKGGHVLMFMAVGFMFALARGASSPLAVLTLAIWFSALCEILQLFSPNRWPSMFDLGLNTGAATAGFLLALGIGVLWRRYSP